MPTEMEKDLWLGLPVAATYIFAAAVGGTLAVYLLNAFVPVPQGISSPAVGIVVAMTLAGGAVAGALSVLAFRVLGRS